MTMPDTRSGGRENAAIGDEQALPGTGIAEGAGTGGESGAREQIRQARDQVVDQARTTLRTARDRAGSSLNEGRRQAAEQIGGIGSAFHRTGEQLRAEDQARFADFADSVGRQIDHVASYLRDSDGRTMTRDLETLARRQPALVFAGAFALGLAAARFLKSSDPASDFDRGSSDFGREDWGYQRGAGGFDAPA
jgi:hypothetical protein